MNQTNQEQSIAGLLTKLGAIYSYNPMYLPEYPELNGNESYDLLVTYYHLAKERIRHEEATAKDENKHTIVNFSEIINSMIALFDRTKFNPVVVWIVMKFIRPIHRDDQEKLGNLSRQRNEVEEKLFRLNEQILDDDSTDCQRMASWLQEYFTLRASCNQNSLEELPSIENQIEVIQKELGNVLGMFEERKL